MPPKYNWMELFPQGIYFNILGTIAELSTTSHALWQSKWEQKITGLKINLLKDVWKDWNTSVHGKSIQEACTNVRAAVIQQVAALYNKPPTLAKWYACVTEISMENHIRKPTAQLQQWLERVKHQIKVSQYLCNPRVAGQLTLPHAYNRARFWELCTYPYKLNFLVSISLPREIFNLVLNSF
jgi:hypothetical protein